MVRGLLAACRWVKSKNTIKQESKQAETIMLGAARQRVLLRVVGFVGVVFVLSVAVLLLILVDEEGKEDEPHWRFLTADKNGPAFWKDNAYFYWQLQQRHDWHAVARYALGWKRAVVRAASDNARAATSTTTALVWTLQPFVWLTTWLLRVVLQDFVYDIVLVRGLCSETAVRQTKLLLQRGVAWQRQLTDRQVAAEVGVLLAAIVLYQLYQFLQRRQYVERIQRRLRALRQSIFEVSRSTML